MSARVFVFEDIDARLPLLPLAARRALDVAGRHLGLGAWRELDLAQRQSLVTAGSGEAVAIAPVQQLADALAAGVRVQPARSEEDWANLPTSLVPRVTAVRWQRLDALERFALTHLCAKPERAKSLELALTELGLAELGLTELGLTQQAPLAAGGAGQPLTHLNARGEAHMVDIAAKAITQRHALAGARVRMSPATARLVVDGRGPKGDVLAAARIAGIQAAKRTPELIPLCHQIALSSVTVSFAVDPDAGIIDIEAGADALDRTGVEMEAMVAASIAALTIYDMLKAAEKGIVVERVVLLEKRGGRSGHYRHQGETQ